MISLPIIIAIFFILLFGVIAIFFSIREERSKQLLKQKARIEAFYVFQNKILKQIQDCTGYSLNTEKLIEIIASNLEVILPYSTVSSMLITNGELSFNINIKEAVNRAFVDQVKNNMLRSLGALLNKPLADLSGENVKGVSLDAQINAAPLSFFNIPVVVNEKVEGIINISSSRKDFYEDEEMTEVYKITELATRALSRLRDVILAEDGKLTALMSSLETSVFTIDLDKKLTMINQPARDLLKVQKDNPTMTDVLSSLPSSYNFADKIDKAISFNQKIEEKNIHYQGGWINVAIIPIVKNLSQQDSRVIGAAFFIHDATPEKSLSKMKEDFTNIIVHELRSPLTSIKASSEMLNGEGNLTEDERKRLISIVYDQTCKMLNEVSMILDAAKLDSGLFTVHKISGDLKKVIADSTESCRNQAQNKFINLVTNIDPFMPAVSFDAAEIRRAITNLLTNSLKFTPGGGTITVRAWTTPDKIFVSVSDTGAGIPVDKQNLLFAKFAQIQTPNATVGTGLGLYIAKGIVEAHNGSIGFQTEVGKGTTITFSIPNNSTAQPLGSFPSSAEKSFSPMSN